MTETNRVPVISIEDEQVFQRAKRGDRAAFAEIVREHQGMVYSLLYHSTRDRETSEEIAQDIFLALYRGLPKLDCASHVTNWLRRVAVQRSIDHARRAKFRPKVGLDDVPEPAAEPAEGVTDPFVSELLRKMTAELPEKARMVLLLRFQEEMELNEIARTLEIPLNTVKSQLHRTLGLLRGKLEKARVRV